MQIVMLQDRAQDYAKYALPETWQLLVDLSTQYNKGFRSVCLPNMDFQLVHLFWPSLVMALSFQCHLLAYSQG